MLRTCLELAAIVSLTVTLAGEFTRTAEVRIIKSDIETLIKSRVISLNISEIGIMDSNV